MVSFNADVQANVGDSCAANSTVSSGLSVEAWSLMSQTRCAAPQPTADLPDLFKAETNFSFAHKEMQDALTALRGGDLKEGVEEVKDALKAINEGMGNVRNGVGGDFDLSQLDESNPLRRIGSGRQAIRAGRNDLGDALELLTGDCPDVQGAIEEIQSSLVNVLGGTGNINKAVGLLERGQNDSRPKHDDKCETEPQPQPECPPENSNPQPEQPQPQPEQPQPQPEQPQPQPEQPQPECPPEQQPRPEPRPEPQPECPPEQPEQPQYPRLEHRHEFNTGYRHLAKGIHALREAIHEISRGDFNDGEKRMRNALWRIQESTQDFRYAFGGETPGNSDFNGAEVQIFRAIRNLRNDNFEDALGGIRKAVRRLTSARTHVVDARDQS
jgi:cellobiose-specific phosphotransferase system component IIA